MSLFCLIPISAQTILEESISIDIEEETIPDALFTLSEHTDINITFSPKLFPSKKKIDIRAVDQPLGEILQRFFCTWKLQKTSDIYFSSKKFLFLR